MATRSKRERQADMQTRGTCPPPCGKVRYVTRAVAKAYARRIQGRQSREYSGNNRLRVYDGNQSDFPCCHGFWHLTSDSAINRIAFYREREAFARQHGLPMGWTVRAVREGLRWRYTIYVPGEEPMPSVYTYATREIAEREAVADINGESRSA